MTSLPKRSPALNYLVNLKASSLSAKRLHGAPQAGFPTWRATATHHRGSDHPQVTGTRGWRHPPPDTPLWPAPASAATLSGCLHRHPSTPEPPAGTPGTARDVIWALTWKPAAPLAWSHGSPPVPHDRLTDPASAPPGGVSASADVSARGWPAALPFRPRRLPGWSTERAAAAALWGEAAAIMPVYFQRPENALKRANGQCGPPHSYPHTHRRFASRSPRRGGQPAPLLFPLSSPGRAGPGPPPELLGRPRGAEPRPAPSWRWGEAAWERRGAALPRRNGRGLRAPAAPHGGGQARAAAGSGPGPAPPPSPRRGPRPPAGGDGWAGSGGRGWSRRSGPVLPSAARPGPRGASGCGPAPAGAAAKSPPWPPTGRGSPLAGGFGVRCPARISHPLRDEFQTGLIPGPVFPCVLRM